MSTHTVKSWPEFFRSIVAGERTHELRPDDRGYRVGDYLKLQEWDPQRAEYTGAQATVQVTSMTSADRQCAVSDLGLADGFCILSIKVAVWSEAVDTDDTTGRCQRPSLS